VKIEKIKPIFRKEYAEIILVRANVNKTHESDNLREYSFSSFSFCLEIINLIIMSINTPRTNRGKKRGVLKRDSI